MIFEKLGKLLDIDDIKENGWVWRGNLWARMFHEHPASINETYLQHMRHSFKIGGRLALLIPITIIHGIFPILFTTTVSRELNDIVNKNNERCEKDNQTKQPINKSPSVESQLSEYITMITSYIKK